MWTDWDFDVQKNAVIWGHNQVKSFDPENTALACSGRTKMISDLDILQKKRDFLKSLVMIEQSYKYLTH